MSEKTKAILAWIFGWIGGLIVLFSKSETTTRETKIHAAQSIVVSVGYWLISVIYNASPIYIPVFSKILWGADIVIIIMGIIKANNGDEPEIPVIADIAKAIFGKKIEEENESL